MRGGSHPPDRVSDIVGDQERAGAIDRDPDRAAVRVAAFVEETGEHIFGRAARLAAGKRNEDHFVADGRLAIPGAVLAHEGAVAVFLRQRVSAVEDQSETRRV